MNIMVTGARAPIAADLAKALALHGHKVWMADSLGAPVSAGSPFVQRLLRLPPPRTDFRTFVSTLAAACAEVAIDAIIPTSEEVFWLAGAAPFLPPTVDVRTSPLSVLAPLHHKGMFARLATSLGYGAPENHEIIQPSDLARLGDPTRFVLKPVYSRFATRTLIGPTTRDLVRLQPSPARPWLAQTRVTGQELCAYNVADAGRLLLHVAYEPMFRIGGGAGVYFSPVGNEGLRVMSERIIQATGFTGQISFDAMETAHGLVALECNPRGTSGVHLAVQQPAVLAAALLGRMTDVAPPFPLAPRMLFLPLLLSHPGSLFRARDRRILRAGKDALTSAGVPPWAQARALAAMAWRAACLGESIALASTADIEWNGEPIAGPPFVCADSLVPRTSLRKPSTTTAANRNAMNHEPGRGPALLPHSLQTRLPLLPVSDETAIRLKPNADAPGRAATVYPGALDT